MKITFAIGSLALLVSCSGGHERAEGRAQYFEKKGHITRLHARWSTPFLYCSGMTATGHPVTYACHGYIDRCEFETP